MRKKLAEQMVSEIAGLKAEILGVKRHFDEEKDNVTRFESTIKFLVNETKRNKKISDDGHM